MGQLDIKSLGSANELRLFMRHLLRDIQAMEYMLDHDMFEKNRSRIGAEQEFFLVDKQMKPAPIGDTLMDNLDSPFYTAELALFNLEANLDPQDFKDNCLSLMENQLSELFELLKTKAGELDAHVLLTGILPTIRKTDLNLANITPKPRYRLLNDVLCNMRGEDNRLNIKGLDELLFTHDNVLIEACNTSFQIHFQVTPENFARYYNIAQAISGPLLAISANSPLLMGKRLWHETRIALFQQAIDTRQANQSDRELEPRVWFGNNWVKDSVLELYQEDIARFRALFAQDISDDPFAALDRGEIPKLEALCLHNGTVYRWNRPCYGISDGKPHLRIENRILPAGPTPQDAIANTAFYLGMLCGYEKEVGDVTRQMDFKDAKTNFNNASMHSLESHIKWFGGKKYRFEDLLRNEMIPLARQGLLDRGINSDDVNRYMDIIEGRNDRHQNGATWMLNSYNFIRNQGFKTDNANDLLTSSMLHRQANGEPVHLWPEISAQELSAIKQTNQTVAQVMTTDIFTVDADDLIDLAAKIMHWNHIRHVAVENVNGELIGIVSYRQILRIYGKYAGRGEVHLVPVREIMTAEPHCVSPETSIESAIDTMRSNRIGCLPVVSNQRLVGMLTESELMDEFSKWLEKSL